MITSARRLNEPHSAGEKNLVRLKHNSSLSFIIITKQWCARRTSGTIMGEKLRQAGKTLTRAVHRIYQNTKDNLAFSPSARPHPWLIRDIFLFICNLSGFTGNCRRLGMIKNVPMSLLFWKIQMISFQFFVKNHTNNNNSAHTLSRFSQTLSALTYWGLNRDMLT